MKTSQVNTYEAILIEQMHAFDEQIDEPYQDSNSVRPHEIWNSADQNAEPPVWGIIYGKAFRNKRILLTNDDFAQGTIRVLVPCKLVLHEDIHFNPNAEAKGKGNDSDKPWFPRADQLAYRPFRPGAGEACQQALKGTKTKGAPQSAMASTPELPKALAPSSGFVLGFFAAITVEHCEGTIIDLNGYRLACHEHFALQQRFHALIELANQPFIAGQGPTAFGPNLRPARKVWIRSGEIGRSSHHGIHGNSMQDILITDVTFRDYEVAAISLNGGRRIVIQDCQLEGTFTRVPVIGTYSAGRFACLMGERTLAFAKRCGYERCREYGWLEEALKKLDAKLKQVFAIVTNPDMKPEEKAAKVDRFFANIDPATGKLGWLPDGNPYGIALHARGVLVNAFLCASSKMGGIGDMSKALECTDVSLQRVNIARTVGNVHEVLAFAFADLSSSASRSSQADNCCEQGGDALTWKVVADAAGAVVRFFPMDSQLHPYWHGRKESELAEMDEHGRPSLTVLGTVQFAIAALECAMGIEQEDASAGNLYGLINWAFPNNKNQGRKKNHQQRIVPAKPGEFPSPGGWQNPEHSPADGEPSVPGLYKLVAGNSEKPLAWLRLRGNGDTMHHVNKGALAVFVQAVDGLCLNRVVVAGVHNVGLPGSLKAGPYQGPDDGGHGAQAQQEGYNGADAFGVYLGACSNVVVDRVQAHGIQSDYGNATGITLAGGTEHAAVFSAVAGNIAAGQAYRLPGESSCKPDVPLSRFPNAAPVGIGLHVDNTTRNIQIDDFQQVGKLTQPSRNYASKIVIESRLNLLNG